MRCCRDITSTEHHKSIIHYYRNTWPLYGRCHILLHRISHYSDQKWNRINIDEPDSSPWNPKCFHNPVPLQPAQVCLSQFDLSYLVSQQTYKTYQFPTLLDASSPTESNCLITFTCIHHYLNSSVTLTCIFLFVCWSFNYIPSICSLCLFSSSVTDWFLLQVLLS